MAQVDKPEGAGRPGRVEAVRQLLFLGRFGILSTISAMPEGFPMGSVVLFGQASRGEPLLLLSSLAQHTKNLQADPRACLLVMTPGAEDPQQAPRAALIGRAVEVTGTEAEDGRARFLQRHPKAGAYFALQFGLWRLDVQEVRFVGGFAQASWVSGAELLDP